MAKGKILTNHQSISAYFNAMIEKLVASLGRINYLTLLDEKLWWMRIMFLFKDKQVLICGYIKTRAETRHTSEYLSIEYI